MHYFLLGDDAFALLLWLMEPYNRRQLIKEDRIAICRVSRGRRVFGECVWNPGLLRTMQQRPKGVRDIVLTCVVLHKTYRGHTRAEQKGQNTHPSR